MSSGGGGGGGVLGSIFFLGMSRCYPIIVYPKANYRPHLSYFWANIIITIPLFTRKSFHFESLLNSTYFRTPQIPKMCDSILGVHSFENATHYRHNGESSRQNATPFKCSISSLSYCVEVPWGFPVVSYPVVLHQISVDSYPF